MLSILCSMLVFSACVSTAPESGIIQLEGAADFSSPSYSAYMNTLPAGGSPVFFAAAPRMSDREAETDACLVNASIQASRFVAARAASYFLVKENNRDLFYIEDLDIQYDRALAEEMLGELTVLQELRDRNGTYILAVLESETMDPIPYNPRPGAGATPPWIKEFPVINGYYVGIGVTQRAGRFDASMADADDKAMEEIIKQISVNQMTDRRDIEVDNVGTAFAQNRREVSDAVILGFYVIDRWVSPDGSNYYSLAVCPRARNTRPE